MQKYTYNSIPQEMKEAKRWILWKLVEVDGKMNKLPYQVNGTLAKSNDEATWNTFDNCLNKYLSSDDFAGLGFVLGDGYVGIDLDNHFNENGELEMDVDDFNNLANHFFYFLKGSYIEKSQSGNGYHIICIGKLYYGSCRRNNIEMYQNGRFFALTGGTLDNYGYENFEVTFPDLNVELKKLQELYMNKTERKNNNIPEFTPRPKSSMTEEEIVNKAMSSSLLFNDLYNGQWKDIYASQSEADLAFCNLLAFWCAKDKFMMNSIFEKSNLMREKWHRKIGDTTYGDITINNAIEHCRNVYNPTSKPETSEPRYYGYESSKPSSPSSPKKYDLNDTGNAKRFIDTYGENLKYNFDNKNWMIFDGKTWVKDVKQDVKKLADDLIIAMKKEAFECDDEEKRKELLKNVKHLSSSSGKEAMLKEAIHIGSIPVVNSDFDKQDFLLNCANGVVDLKSGKILPHDKQYMLSKNTDLFCDMNTEPERWKKFLLEIFGNNQEMVDFIQKAIGYTLTGSTKEHCFFQCFGVGSNGKSVFLDTMYEMLGGYSLNSQADSILSRANFSGGANSEIARMKGARMVRTNEPNEGSRFNEGLVKQLVGGDVTTARFLYGMEFEFKPTLKLWIATNYKIGVRGTDDGIWRRNLLIPFKEKFEGSNRDRDLKEKLFSELPSILGWAVKGCLRWQKEGLTDNIPSAILDETKEYKFEMDVVSRFIEDCCRPSTVSREKASDVYREFDSWAKLGHEPQMSQCKFGVEMSKKYQKKTINGYTYYYGFTLKKNDTSYVYEKENN